MENRGYTYHIKDSYFDKLKKLGLDKGLMSNKEGEGFRPTYYCLEDGDTGLLYMIPLSTRTEKYREIYRRSVDRYGECLGIVLGSYDGKAASFLLQNMFPITEKYIDHVHTRNGNPVPVNKKIRDEIGQKIGKLRALVKRGKKVVFPDLSSIEAVMAED